MKVLTLLLLVSAIAAAGCSSAARPVSVGDKPTSVNGVPQDDSGGGTLKLVSDMSWTDLDGSVHKIKDLKGKVIILDFWATYCPPCIEMIPHLMELKAKYPDDLVVIGLHVGGDEDRPKIADFLKQHNVNYPIAYPEDGLTAYVFGSQSAIPQTAVFDREGRLVKKIAGFNNAIRIELDEAVEKTVKGIQ